MPLLLFDVIADGARWKLHHNFYNKFFQAREDALRAAVDSARAAAALGNHVQVREKHSDGSYDVYWTAREDPGSP